MAKKKKDIGVGGTIVFVVLLACVVVGIYLVITRQDRSGALEASAERTEAQTLIAKDLSKEYPQTLRETVKLYARITKCLYNDDLTEDDIDKLCSQLRMLYSDELLEANPEETMRAFLEGEIGNYHQHDKSIYSYTIDDASNIKYISDSAGKRGIIYMYFTVKEGKGLSRAFEEMVLREDSDGHWKIIGWRSTDETNIYGD